MSLKVLRQFDDFKDTPIETINGNFNTDLMSEQFRNMPQVRSSTPKFKCLSSLCE